MDGEGACGRDWGRAGGRTRQGGKARQAAQWPGVGVGVGEWGGGGVLGVYTGGAFSFIPIPNPCSLLHFWRHLIINLF